MRIGHLETWTLRIRTLTPVHIGCNQRLTKREYMLIPGRREVCVPDLNKLTRYLYDRGKLESYEQYLLGFGASDLGEYLKKQGIPQTDWSSFVAYALDAGDIPNIGGRFEINMFTKDGAGYPYLPGSSVKGAVRTALLAAYITRDPWSPKGFPSKAGRQLEEHYFRTLPLQPRNQRNAVNDMLRGLHISDSDPLPHAALTIAQKIDRGFSGKENELNLYRECLRPGIEISLRLTLDHSYLKHTDLSMQTLTKALQDFSSRNDRDFLRRFSLKDIMLPGAVTPLFLGGGSGYVTKTVSFALWGSQQPRRVGEMMTHCFPRHGHQRSAELGVAPHMIKLTRVHGQLVPMGLCDVAILPHEGGSHAASV